MEEGKINAVRCGKCGRNNPRLSNNCTNCGKKLDLSDQLVYDKNFEKNSARPAKWTAASLIMFALVFAALFFFLLNILKNSSDKSSTTFSDNTTIASAGTPKDENVSLIIDINKIVGKTLPQVEKILGKAESKEKVEGYPCTYTNCQRAYFKNGSYQITFKKSKADRIKINGTPDLTSSDNAIQALGLPSSKPSFKNPSFVLRWTNFQGFEDISFFTNYILVQRTKSE